MLGVLERLTTITTLTFQDHVWSSVT